MDREGAKAKKRQRRARASSRWLVLANAVAWLVVLGVTVWLLSLTLRASDQISLGRVRISDPARELNLRPFSNKLRPLRNLESSSAATRRSARTYLLVDVLGNVVVFVPFGAALATATLTVRMRTNEPRQFWRWWASVTAAGLALSLLIELAQLAIPSRVTDVDDILLNTVGTAVGALIIWGAFRLADTT